MKNISIKWKLMAINLFVILVFSAMTYLLLSEASGVLRSYSSDYAVALMSKSAAKMESYIGEVDRAMLSLYYSDSLKNVFAQGTAYARMAAVNEEIDHLIAAYKHKNIHGVKVHLINNQMQIIASSDSSYVGKLRMLGANWLRKIYNQRGDLVIISGYPVMNSANATTERVIGLSRAIVAENKTSGYLLLEMPLDYLAETAGQVKIGKNGSIAILDPDGILLYTTNTKRIGSIYQIKDDDGEEIRTDGIYNIDGETMIVSVIHSDYLEFNVLGFLSEKEIMGDVITLRATFNTAILIIALMAILYSVYVASTITRPIGKLVAAMHSPGENGLPSPIKMQRGDELGHLVQGFNDMSQELNGMIDRVYKAQISEQKALISALISNISPHFIYNTLEAIRMEAYLHDDMKVVHMLGSFADMMRNMVDYEGRYIQVTHEVNAVMSYLNLMQLRKEGLFTVQWEVEEAAQNCYIMRSVLQPLVENSIKHGFRGMNTGGVVHIRIGRSADGVEIQVTDNGCGMSKEERERTWHAIHDRKIETRYMALRNLYERLYLTFREKGALEIVPAEPSGIRVEVRMPAVTEKDVEMDAKSLHASNSDFEENSEQ